MQELENRGGTWGLGLSVHFPCREDAREVQGPSLPSSAAAGPPTPSLGEALQSTHSALTTRVSAGVSWHQLLLDRE